MENQELERKLKEREAIIADQQSKIDQLAGQGELKSHLVYQIANDLRTPLTNIIGFSKLLSGGEFGQLNAEQQSHMASIIDESNRLMDTIMRIREAVQLESNKMPLELTEVNLREMYNDPSIRMLEEVANNKGLGFSWNIDLYDKPLFKPNSRGEIDIAVDADGNISLNIPIVKADYGKILQAFVNLIGNSIKFTKSGSITVEIKTKMPKKSRSTFIECSVIDTGIGISDEARHRLFREFYSNKTKQEGAGIGLGLSLTKRIVELHGGKIGYEPREGGGSRFWFTLPIKRRGKPSRND
jgi:signal transduction histidine kinase